MAFSHSQYVDASRSTFNNVGRDQTFNNNVRISHAIINIYPSGSGQTLQHCLGPTSGPGVPQSVLVPMCHSSAVISTADTAVGIIVNIVHLLLMGSSDEHRRLERELKSLCQSLILTRSAIQVYEYTPLAQNLANAIHPEVERCHAVLRETLDKIVHYRESLKSTNIRRLWFKVWWMSVRDGDELALSRTKLAGHQESLNKFLMALNSYVLIFHASAPTETSHSVINIKCCMDGPWKRIARKSCIYRKILCFVKATSAPSASHPNKQGASSGSLGTKPTGANAVLFHMEGKLYFVHVSAMLHVLAS
jgi:hypothetical protein